MLSALFGDSASKNQLKLWLAERSDVAFDVRQFMVRERMSSLWSLTVEFSSNDPNLAFDSFVDKGAAFEIEGRNRVWSGVCTHFAHLSATPNGTSLYRVEIGPSLVRATLNRNSRIHKHASVPEIVAALLERWGYEKDKSFFLRNFELTDYERFPRYEYRVQYEESDYEFFCRMLEEAGIAWYWEYKNERSGKGQDLTVLVLDSDAEQATDSESGGEGEGQGGGGQGGQSNRRVKRVVGPLPYLGERGDASGEAGIVVNAGATRYVRPGRVMVIDHEFRRPLGAFAHEKAEADVKTSEPKYEVVTYAPGILQRERNRDHGDEVVEYRDSARARNVLRGLRADALLLQFQTTELGVCPGAVVAIGEKGIPIGAREHPRTELKTDKKHLVVESQVSGDPRGDVIVRCWAVDAGQPFRPPEVTRKPRIAGLQSAIVVAPDDREIHCDEYGRVHVQFHWDRQNRYGQPLSGDEAKQVDGLGSCWVRVATPWAGSSYGFSAVPRAGHEVLISFLEGDPDQPVIVGSVYNGANAPPYALPGSNTVTGIKTSSSPGAGGFNEMYFDDKKGSEKVHFQAEKALSTVVKATETHSVGKNRTTNVGETDKLHIGKRWELAVGADQTGIAVTEDMVSIQVGGGGGAQIKIQNNNVFVNAHGSFHSHSVGDTHLSAQGKILIDGAEVKINCGEPHPAQTEAYVVASAPAPGSSIVAGPRARGGGGMVAAAGPIAKDIDFGGEGSQDGAAGAGRGASSAGGGLGIPGMGQVARAVGTRALEAAKATATAVVSAAVTGGNIRDAALGAATGAVGGAVGAAVSSVVPGALAPVLSSTAGALASTALKGGKASKEALAAGAGAAAGAIVGATVGSGAQVAGQVAAQAIGARSQPAAPTAAPRAPATGAPAQAADDAPVTERLPLEGPPR